MKKVALYCRVSTNHQSTDAQRADLEAYCSRQDWRIVKTYDDSGVSGATDDRPALRQMLADAKRGRFQVAVVFKIDRLARSTVDLLKILMELKQSGVDFVSTTQAIDTTTSYGKMVLTFLGAIAEFERETIVERVRSGLDRAKANGVKLGRPKTEFDVTKALEMKRQGKTWSEIAKALAVSRATVRRVITPLLKNPVSPQG